MSSRGGALPRSRAELAALLDHTLLRPEATEADVVALAREGNDLGVAAVCVHPARVAAVAAVLAGPATCSVVGFPSGVHEPAVLGVEAERAVAAGAVEVDMVIDVGALRAGDTAAVEAQLAAVRERAAGAVLKVIIESAALTDHEIVTACELAVAARADFVKTSTGFHPAGGASVEAVRLMAATVGPRGLRVKASGGIRTLEAALAMIEAGADRIGCSASRQILDALG